MRGLKKNNISYLVLIAIIRLFKLQSLTFLIASKPLSKNESATLQIEYELINLL